MPEKTATLVLSLAWVVSITFYLELLGVFVLHLFAIQSWIYQQGIATALVLFIGIFIIWRGPEPPPTRLEGISRRGRLRLPILV